MLSDDPGLESVDVFWEHECVSVGVCEKECIPGTANATFVLR